jgi:hypothetical protein
MTTEVSKLTPENAQDSHISLGEDAPENLTGVHEGRVFYMERKVSAKGTPYHSVGVEITSSPGQGESVFGVVFRGKSRDEFLRALKLEPAKVRGQLNGQQVIGQRVRITVAAEEQEAVGGGTETRWVIREFAPLA